MLFNSYIYLFVFLPVVLSVFYLLKNKIKLKGVLFFLTVCSYCFYSYWNPKYFILIFISVLFNYSLGIKLSNKKEKWLLVSGICINLIPLLYYKYSGFILDNLGLFWDFAPRSEKLELPLAISFFTFQQIAYLVDSYKSKTREYGFVNYSLFVSFFPQLIAGPIVHHKDMMPQFAQKSFLDTNFSRIKQGIIIFSLGLFKKVVIADSLSVYVQNGFIDKNINFYEAWVSSLSYTMQLYFDFSGYSDMAIGSALLFNIVIVENFNSPYKSKNLQDFWRRWHITLGKWLKDYIYIPLGGSRNGELVTAFSLGMTFIVGGIWHGAGWNFLIWGALHGAGLIILNLRKKFLGKLKISKLVGWGITFLYVHIGWVFFRSDTLETALRIVTKLFGFSGVEVPQKLCSAGSSFFAENCLSKSVLSNISNGDSMILVISMLIIASCVAFFAPNSKQLERFLVTKKYSLPFVLIVLVISILFLSRESEFLYFQF